MRGTECAHICTLRHNIKISGIIFQKHLNGNKHGFYQAATKEANYLAEDWKINCGQNHLSFQMNQRNLSNIRLQIIYLPLNCEKVISRVFLKPVGTKHAFFKFIFALLTIPIELHQSLSMTLWELKDFLKEFLCQIIHFWFQVNCSSYYLIYSAITF